MTTVPEWPMVADMLSPVVDSSSAAVQQRMPESAVGLQQAVADPRYSLHLPPTTL